MINPVGSPRSVLHSHFRLASDHMPSCLGPRLPDATSPSGSSQEEETTKRVWPRKATQSTSISEVNATLSGVGAPVGSSPRSKTHAPHHGCQNQPASSRY